MTREIHDIPPTPRTVRWRAVLWHWWPVAFAGFMLGVYGGLMTLMLFLAKGGKLSDDVRLDAASVRVIGMVTRIQGGAATGTPLRLTYRYPTPGDRELEGRCFLNRPDLMIEDDIQIEYVKAAPHVSRAVGGHIALGPPLHLIFLWVVLLPGLLCTASWFIAALWLRRMMSRGDVAVADVLAIETIRYVQPGMLRVMYQFKDRRSEQHVASHWVRTRSALGERLDSNPKQLAVIHNRSGRGGSRLVMADDFVVQRTAAAHDNDDLAHH